jgi:hypothetical protein
MLKNTKYNIKLKNVMEMCFVHVCIFIYLLYDKLLVKNFIKHPFVHQVCMVNIIITRPMKIKKKIKILH